MTTAPTATAPGDGGEPGIPAWRDYLSLVKPRITLLVLVTTAAGFYLGSAGPTDVPLLLHTLLGTFLVAAGTSAMNQVLERDVDARMERTRRRPLPAGRLALPPAAAFALALSVAGTVYLAVTTNVLTAFLAGSCFLVYDLLYTPLKRVHPLATLVGAVPGALPVAGGWTAATGRLDPGAWVLFGILFLWQLPHFLALAWLFRDDYRRAGLKMLSVEDPDGLRTRQHALGYALVLVPVSLLPASMGLAGTLYVVSALVLGALLVVQAARFFRSASRRSAGRLFRATVLYLPLLLGLLAADKALSGAGGGAGWGPGAAAEPAAASEARVAVAGLASAAGLAPARFVPADDGADAEGCPGCIRGSSDGAGRGFFWSALFLMLVPYLVLGSIGGGLVAAWRRGSRARVERLLAEVAAGTETRTVARPGRDGWTRGAAGRTQRWTSEGRGE